MVVRMEQFLSCEFVASVSDNFIYIHICLSTAACLIYDQRKFTVEFAVKYLLSHS